MAERRGRKNISRNNYKKYLDVAEHFYKAAQDSIELDYWTAAGVLVVHSAIAYSDALSIKIAGIKSIGDNHEDAVTILEEKIAASDEKNKALNQLKRIIDEKTKVSYLGDLYSAAQTKDMWKKLERFRKWSLDILNR